MTLLNNNNKILSRLGEPEFIAEIAGSDEHLKIFIMQAITEKLSDNTVFLDQINKRLLLTLYDNIISGYGRENIDLYNLMNSYNDNIIMDLYAGINRISIKRLVWEKLIINLKSEGFLDFKDKVIKLDSMTSDGFLKYTAYLNEIGVPVDDIISRLDKADVREIKKMDSIIQLFMKRSQKSAASLLSSSFNLIIDKKNQQQGMADFVKGLFAYHLKDKETLPFALNYFRTSEGIMKERAYRKIYALYYIKLSMMLNKLTEALTVNPLKDFIFEYNYTARDISNEKPLSEQFDILTGFIVAAGIPLLDVKFNSKEIELFSDNSEIRFDGNECSIVYPDHKIEIGISD